ncbi:DUF397 domain-containing protein [Streptomyces griseoviridis]|uniref:DUF397 domain-containing protein n=1 Tax=Streptomyces griseoviridis TaxID=45398 RepID=A0A3S9ZCQ6_STRGD|nr:MULTISPECIES: DUF397 domain-containing protein [Streptomyces]AZS85510.1 DUF397 domain-containing protein [Streptomyces griseoviridis]MDH6698877.1 hypothetical protein [Streptomyces sp. MAA16]QCN87641.1 DUF397 domain-containing protein [Streptomyces griseoviridis]
MTTESPRWFSSSYSGNGGQCIEIAVNLVSSLAVVPVRDSKNPDGPVLTVPADVFSSFVAGIKGESGVM